MDVSDWRIMDFRTVAIDGERTTMTFKSRDYYSRKETMQATLSTVFSELSYYFACPRLALLCAYYVC